MVAVVYERRRAGGPSPMPARRLQVVDEDWFQKRAAQQRRLRALPQGAVSGEASRVVAARSAVARPDTAPSGTVPRQRSSAAVLRRRRCVLVLLGGLLCLGIVLVGRDIAGAPPTSSPATPASRGFAERVWIVRPGDTVWSLVEASGVRGDIRPVVDGLQASLHGRPLQVGQRLVVWVPR